MGADNKPVSKTTQAQQQETLQTSTSKHPKFSNAVIIRDQNDSSHIQVTQSVSSISVYNSWEKRLEQIKRQIGANSLYLALECSYQQQGFCGNSGILKLRFDYYPFLLEEQILNRQAQNLPFEEKEIWFLLYILAQTASALHKINLTVGDIRPKNIFINPIGDIALFNSFSFPQEFTNYQKTSYFKEFTYLPPEGVNDIQTGKQSPTYDEKIGQSFSIGLTILDAIFLTDHSFLYDKMSRFNEIAFKQITDALQQSTLNENLKHIILSLVSINPSTRLSCQQLCQFLAPYQNSIFELENFEIKNELKKKITENDGSPSKSTGSNAKGKHKRQSLSRPITVNDSVNKNIAQNKDSQSYVANPSENRIRQLPDSNKNLSAQNTIGYSKQRISQSQQTSPSQQVIERSYSIPTKQFNALPQSAFNKITLESNPILPTSFDKKFETLSKQVQRPIQSSQEYLKKFQFYANGNKTGIENPSPYFKTQENKQIKMTFKTGSLFQQQRKSVNPTFQENTQFSKTLNLGYENPKVDYKQSIYETYAYEKTKTNKDSGIPSQSYQTFGYEFSSNKANEFRPSLGLNETGSNNYADFLKNIDKQIQQSRNLFPDSMK